MEFYCYIHRTRYKELGYAEASLDNWRFVDLRRNSQIAWYGQPYPSKMDLLLALDQTARELGCALPHEMSSADVIRWALFEYFKIDLGYFDELSALITQALRDAEKQKRQKPLDADAYRMALRALDACNLSGVVFDFAELMYRICHETRESGNLTKHEHPLSVLYAEKIYSLTGRGNQFGEAYTKAKEFAIPDDVHPDPEDADLRGCQQLVPPTTKNEPQRNTTLTQIIEEATKAYQEQPFALCSLAEYIADRLEEHQVTKWYAGADLKGANLYGATLPTE